jgi:protease-4
MRESIFRSAIRSFFVTLFALIGIAVGLIPLMLVFSSIGSTTTTSEPERKYKLEYAANADNVRKVLSSDSPAILKLNITGVIGVEELNTESVRRQLIESREGDLKNNRVKAVLLYINSPGGTTVDSDNIYEMIKAYKKQYSVPVYAYVDGLCASGGMYIASAADKIYSNDSSLIGSVGVISPSFFNFTQLIDKIGVEALTLFAGKDKDLMNPLRPWNPEEQKIVQGLIDFYYNRFVDIVATNRKMDKEKLVKDYGAKIFNPKDATAYGFINSDGYSYNMALKELVKSIGIEDSYYQVVELTHKSWYNELFGMEMGLLSGKVTHRIQLSSELDPALMNKFLYLYQPR